MKLSQISSAVVLATLPISGVFAAALDRSGQSMSAFFQEGNYAEANLAILDPTVSGAEANNSPAQNEGKARNIEDMGESYVFPSAAIKLQPHEKISVAVLYDQPFGADAEYKGTNKFNANDAETLATREATTAPLTTAVTKYLTTINQNTALVTANGGKPYTQADIPTLAQSTTLPETVTTPAKQIIAQQTALTTLASQSANSNTGKSASELAHKGTTVDVHTQNLSLVVGYQPTKNWNIYAGPAYQNVKANVHLRGTAYSVFNGYDAYAPTTGGLGWLAGVAYSKPEIALRASVTYRSEIDHDIDVKENLTSDTFTSGKTRITLPQSVNLDLQSGVAPDTLAFLNVRWVDWSSFVIQPHKFAQLSRNPLVQSTTGKPEFNLVSYSKDQISANLGVGRKFSDRWSGNVSVGWDSGAGNPVSTLGPTKGYWNTGVGVQFSPAKNYFISGGVKHFWLGDTKAQSGAQAGSSDYIADFKDNKAWAYGLKIGYRF